MKLEIGKRYLLRNRSVTEPLTASTSYTYPFQALVDGDMTLWTESGTWLSNQEERQWDIVAEYTGQTTTKAPTPETDAFFSRNTSLMEKWERMGEFERERDEWKERAARYAAEREHNAMQGLAYKAERDDAIAALGHIRSILLEKAGQGDDLYLGSTAFKSCLRWSRIAEGGGK